MLDVRLDLGLFLVAQLGAGAREELDAVVGEGVVRGADDDAGVRAALVDQRGEPRRRDHAGDLHARAAAGEAGRERRLEHRAAEPRVAADHEQRVRAGLLRQHHGRRAADLDGELRGQQFAGDAADAVRAEVRAHARPSPQSQLPRLRCTPSILAVPQTADGRDGDARRPGTGRSSTSLMWNSRMTTSTATGAESTHGELLPHRRGVAPRACRVFVAGHQRTPRDSTRAILAPAKGQAPGAAAEPRRNDDGPPRGGPSGTAGLRRSVSAC